MAQPKQMYHILRFRPTSFHLRTISGMPEPSRASVPTRRRSSRNLRREAAGAAYNKAARLRLATFVQKCAKGSALARRKGCPHPSLRCAPLQGVARRRLRRRWAIPLPLRLATPDFANRAEVGWYPTSRLYCTLQRPGLDRNSQSARGPPRVFAGQPSPGCGLAGKTLSAARQAVTAAIQLQGQANKTKSSSPLIPINYLDRILESSRYYLGYL